MQPSESQLKTLEALIHQALKLDPALQQQLKSLAGKSIHIECKDPKAEVVIVINANNIYLETLQAQKITSHLTGDFIAFAQLLSAEDKVSTLINGDLRLQGDSQVLVELQKILQSIDIDWEFQLAKLIGDMPAHFLGKLSRDGISWLRSTQPIFMRHLQEFVLEEAKLSPTKQELDAFIHSIQSVRERVERIEAKLSRLKQLALLNKDHH
jgi:ubiquinone biosynthesis protein UbiJ